jgi:enoyl-CoA hydratase
LTAEAVRVARVGPVTTVLLSRPERRNAVDGPTALALADAFRSFEADPDAAVAVLHGEGGVFCAGADLKAVGTESGNRVQDDGDGPMGPTRMRLSKPVIAAIAGHAVAGGLELALWCDLRVAEEDAVLGVFCRRWGVPLIDGGTVRLPRLIGLGRALDLILTGRAVAAAEAMQMGLVSRVVPHGQARAAAEALAHKIAEFPQACLRSDRQSAVQSLSLTDAEAMVNEFWHGMTALAAPGLADEIGRFRGGAGRGGAPA